MKILPLLLQQFLSALLVTGASLWGSKSLAASAVSRVSYPTNFGAVSANPVVRPAACPACPIALPSAETSDASPGP
eukprot:scaffold171930_cov17-Prasinocladus_malaysianus.AAC.2